MALSTVIPRTMIRPESDTVCRSIPFAHIIPRVVKIEVGIAIAAIRAILTGSRRTVTNMTAISAMANSLRKLPIAFDTTSGILEMVMIFTSGGSAAENLSIAFCTSLPKWTTFSPVFISSETSKHFFPFTRIYESTSPYSRTTLAISLTRTTLPRGSEYTI